MNEIRYFKRLGLKYVDGDRIDTCFEIVTGNFDVNECEVNDNLIISEFAWRTNTGEKPSYTGRIEVELDCGLVKQAEDSSKIGWLLIGVDGDVIKWRPILQSNKNTVEEVVKSVVDSDEFVHGQDIYLANEVELVSRDWKFGCYTLGGKSCILLSDTGHVVMPILGITATPPKTDEQILREELITWIYSDASLGAYDNNQEAALTIDSIINSGKFTIKLNK